MEYDESIPCASPSGSQESGALLYGEQELYFCDRTGRVIQLKTIKDAYDSQKYLPYTYTYTNNGEFERRKVIKVV